MIKALLGKTGSLLRNREALFYLVLIAIAAAMRFWHLDLRPLHFDESMHAKTAWNIYKGVPYVHDPVIHGPFQFLVTAFSYVLLRPGKTIKNELL